MRCVGTGARANTHTLLHQDKPSLTSSTSKDLYCGVFFNWSNKIMKYGTVSIVELLKLESFVH